MVLRQIEQLKVEQIQLNLRPFYNVEAHAGKDLEQLILHQRNRVNAADGRMLARLGHVDRFTLQFLFLLDLLDLAVQRIHLLGQALTDDINHLTGLRALLGGKLAHRAQKLCQIALLAQHFQAQRIQARLVANIFQLTGGFFLDFAQLFLHIHVVCILLLFEKEKSPVPQGTRLVFLVVPPKFTSRVHHARPLIR